MIGLVLLFFALGALAGAVHFAALARDADLLVRGGSALAVIGLRLGRMLLTVAMLVVAARQGWPALVAASIGTLVARQLVLRRLGAA
ncbi:ATP synthase subunit I [Sphingomonas aracearum]|uniref:ATP synthase subunit I n=1 Tax=Sphingomonas aracearum TaxID=2283317 RepID=A0A369VU41_9SPHN|nr:ATP synthase subunit I [Sphingomonas aracearum]RDE05603.1 ATP synthase subunit I [Sphingomonas aracearum]